MIDLVHKFSELPEKWITLRKMAMKVKQEIGPIKNYQSDVIMKRITLHTYQVNAFQGSFKSLPVGIVIEQGALTACIMSACSFGKSFHDIAI